MDGVIKLKNHRSKLITAVGFIGSTIILIALLGIVLTFGPAAGYEVKYDTTVAVNKILTASPIKTPLPPKQITPPNMDFSIVIQKIEASAPIVDNVDPFDENAFRFALRRGVAHAKDTAYPGQTGNIYLFAHSTDAFYNVGRYNAVFYLIGKLQNGDEIKIYYKNKEYKYIVYNKLVVNPDALGYLKTIQAGVSTLTLQTCYPPGTTLQRLVVLAIERKS